MVIALDDQPEGSKWASDQTADDERQQHKERQHEGCEQGNGQCPVRRVGAREFRKNAKDHEIPQKQRQHKPSDALPEDSPTYGNHFPVAQVHAQLHVSLELGCPFLAYGVGAGGEGGGGCVGPGPEMASSAELVPGAAESAAGLEMSDRGWGWADQ